MDNPIAAALFITGIGVPMLFAALALLIVTMLLLTSTTRERLKAPAEESAGTLDRQTAAHRAAAIAVALARAEAELSPLSPASEEPSASPWRQYHRQRVLSLKPRKSL